MVRLNEIRAGEVAVEAPSPTDAGLVFIGRIRTPWTDRLGCPRQGRADGPACRIEVFPPWREALDGVALYERLEVLYWLDRSRRDLSIIRRSGHRFGEGNDAEQRSKQNCTVQFCLVRQSPADDGITRGTFSLRSPVRPNPIGTSIVALIRVEEGMLHVRGLDCLDGTPLLDIKPDRQLFTPLAPPQPGDAEIGTGA